MRSNEHALERTAPLLSRSKEAPFSLIFQLNIVSDVDIR